MPCLDKLWKKESGWNHKAANRSSGAYGIPQALPGSKMASDGSELADQSRPSRSSGASATSRAATTRPCGAWSHSQSTGWY